MFSDPKVHETQADGSAPAPGPLIAATVAPEVVVSPQTLPTTEVVFPYEKQALEAAPGLWETGAAEGMICLSNLDMIEHSVEAGEVVAVVSAANVRASKCYSCGTLDTDAWFEDEEDEPIQSSRCRICSQGVSL